MATSAADKVGIVSAEAKLVRIPVDPPCGDAIQKFDCLELPMISIKDGAGNTGVGFSYTIGKGGTAVLSLLRSEVIGELIDEDSRCIAGLSKKLLSSIHALTPGCISSLALAAVDVALWDLLAKRANMPLYILLGGAKRKILAYNTHVGWLSRTLDEMIDLCKEATDRRGFRALKIKVGKDEAEEDRERIAKVRQAVGPSIKLMVDANQKWSLPEAVKRAKMLEPYDIVWLEEPLMAQQIDGYLHLGLHTSIARAGGESIYSIQEFFNNIRYGALDILQPDVARIGGITNAMRVCALAQSAGLPVSPHVSPELSTTVAVACPNSVFIEYIPQMEPILKKKITIENGYAVPFDADGHGIEFDDEAMDRLEVKKDEPKGRSGCSGSF